MTKEIIMLPIKQKQVVDKITTAGFKASDFIFEPKSNEEFSLIYKAIPGYIFQRTENPTARRFEYCPGSNGEYKSLFIYLGFGSLIDNMDKWLSALKENIEIGNPWKEIEDTFESMVFNSYDEMFTVTEQENIAEKLNHLLTYFETLKIDVSKIADDIEHLNEMSSKVSKKDWIILFLGNITGFIINGLITTEDTSNVWAYINTLFSGLNPTLLQ